MNVLTEAVYTQLGFCEKKKSEVVILACWEKHGWGTLEPPTCCSLELSVPTNQAGFFPLVSVQAGAEGCWRGRGSRDGVWPHRLLLPQGRGDSPTPLTPFLTPQLGEAIFIINRKKKILFSAAKYRSPGEKGESENLDTSGQSGHTWQSHCASGNSG